MARPVLLDVNVLIALFDSAHVHHRMVHAWFDRVKDRGWRSCPITENGFFRILSHTAYPNGAVSVTDLAGRLAEFKRTSSSFEFWPDDFRFADWLQEARRLIPSAKLTDGYLLKLAAAHNGALATLDRGITCELVGETQLEVLEWVR